MIIRTDPVISFFRDTKKEAIRRYTNCHFTVYQALRALELFYISGCRRC